MKTRTRFLVVEDSELDAEFICRWLNRQFLCNLTCASTSAAARSAFRPRTFDAVFINLKLGVDPMAGLELLREFRAQELDLPLFVITGAELEEARRRAIACGASGFFSKDFDGTEAECVRNTIALRHAAMNQGRGMKHKGTTIGGAIQALGTTLMGVGIVPSLTSMTAAEDLKWVVIAGFVLKALGEQVTAVFAADARVVDARFDNQQNQTKPND